MTLHTLRLLRIELTVSDLLQAEQFYVDSLGFKSFGHHDADPAYAALLGAHGIREAVLRRGEQEVALQVFSPQGVPYPEGAAANDECFQHFALVADDIAVAYARLLPSGARPISSTGPINLPQHSGGATAYKFRDPDGHPLELIQFPKSTPGGIDHSAISITDVHRSIAFYRDELGFAVNARQVNTGAEQDALDGLPGVTVEVVALTPQQATPHVELLAYRTPPGRPMSPQQPRDIAATRLLLDVTGLPEPATLLSDGSRACLMRDPDGHLLVLQEQRTH